MVSRRNRLLFLTFVVLGLVWAIGVILYQRPSKARCFSLREWNGEAIELDLMSLQDSDDLLIRRRPFVPRGKSEQPSPTETSNVPVSHYRYEPGEGLNTAPREAWDATKGSTTSSVFGDVYPEVFLQRRQSGKLHMRQIAEEYAGSPAAATSDIRMVESRSGSRLSLISADFDTRNINVPFVGGHKPKCSGRQHYHQVVSLSQRRWVTEPVRLPMVSWTPGDGDGRLNAIAVAWSADERYVVIADGQNLCIIDVPVEP